MPRRLIIAITGASGAVFGVRLLELARALDKIETHLIVSPAGWLNIEHELERPRAQIEALADIVHAPRNIGASIASGSFNAEAMVVAPCSMRTLGAVAHGLSDNLVARAADVILKERRRLVLITREAPLNLAHLRNMVSVTEMGGIIFPPVPAFYSKVKDISGMVNHTVGRILDLFDVQHENIARWEGVSAAIGSKTKSKGKKS
jgi:4-hydroxy-3-polyprenylbenzoate decarboxylase